MLPFHLHQLYSKRLQGIFDFLADRKAIKAMVEADCEAAGIPNTL